MGFLDRLFGSEDARRDEPPIPPRGAASGYRDDAGQYSPPPTDGAPVAAGSDEDQQAVERYRYLLRTAPPETIEQVHAEAFGRLTPAQRQQVLADLSATLPPAERPAGGDPRTLARAEYTQPGYMERTFGNRSWGGAGAPGFGSMVGASILGTIGGYVIGSALVSAFFAPGFADGQGHEDGVGEAAGGDAAGGDAAGDFGDGFGDFGGGDFGGFDGF